LSKDFATSFDTSLRSKNDLIRFTILFYDESGFELCDTDVTPYQVVNDNDQIVELLANDHFYCSRSDYLNANRWSIKWVFPKLSASEAVPAPSTETRATGNSKPKDTRKNTSARKANGDTTSTQVIPQDEFETLTGFDYNSGHLETRSGKTFVVYRQGERTTAVAWDSEALMGKQARLHIKCDASGECLVENLRYNEAVHARPLK